MQDQLPIVTLLREPKVTAATGKSRSLLWQEVKEGLFTPPIRIGAGRSVGWPANEVAAINRARIASKTDEEIQTLVKALITARTA